MVPANPTARATEVRSRRAALKKAIANRPALAGELLEGRATDPAGWGPVAAEMPLEALVRAVPGVGPAAAREVLDGVPSDARLYALTMERRRQIAGRLETR